MDEPTLMRMERLWKEGMLTRLIAKEINYSAQEVRTVAMKNRDRFPYRRHVVPQDVREDLVRKLEGGEVTKEEVMQRYGVCRFTVNSWLRNAANGG